ncbi:MAG: PilZ domain-containing protein [Dehalococcoidia bacterium]
MVTERRQGFETEDLTEQVRAAIGVRWIDPHTGRDTEAKATIQDILPEGIVIVRLAGPALPERGQVVRLMMQTTTGPFVLHAKVFRTANQHMALVRPITDPRFHERRRAPRAPNPSIRLQSGGAPISQVLDVSAHGARFIAPTPAEVGDRLNLELELDGGQRIAVVATVVASGAGDSGEPVVRCRFDELGPDQAREIVGYVTAQFGRQPERTARLRLDRLPATAVVLVRGEWIEGDPFEVRMLELGVSLARFSSERRLSIGATVRLEITIPGTPVLTIEAEIADVGTDPGNPLYEARLPSLSEAARRAILSNVIRFLAAASIRSA